MIALALAALGGSALAHAADEDPRLTLGRNILKLMTDGKYDDFCAKGDEMMKSGFSPTRARLTWDRLESQLGKFQKEDSATMTTQGENATISFVWTFERGVAAGRLHLDKGDRMSGFWFDRMDVRIPPPPYADPTKYKEENIVVTAGSMPLNGRLCVPLGDSQHPGVVLLHAYGALDMDGGMGAVQVLRDLAWGLASNGVATIRYDKRNRAFPKAVPPENWTFETEILEDARAAIQMLRERPEIDKSRIFIVGHGLGATAALALAKEDRRLAGVVLLAAPGRLPVDQIEDEVAYIANLDGAVNESEQSNITHIGDACQRIRNDDASSVPDLVMGQPAKYWAELCRYKPAEIAGRLELPMFVAHGGRDYKVNKKDADAWKKLAAEHKNITCRVFDGLNHQLVKGDAPSTPDDIKFTGIVDETLVKNVIEWIGAQKAVAGAAASGPTSGPVSKPAGATSKPADAKPSDAKPAEAKPN